MTYDGRFNSGPPRPESEIEEIAPPPPPPPRAPGPKKPGFWSRVGNALGEMLGEYLFGGGR